MPSAKASKASADEVATDILDEPETEPEAEQQAEPEAPEQAPDTDGTAVESAVPHRTETYEATRPDGTRVSVQRDIDTGEQTVTVL